MSEEVISDVEAFLKDLPDEPIHILRVLKDRAKTFLGAKVGNSMSPPVNYAAQTMAEALYEFARLSGRRAVQEDQKEKGWDLLRVAVLQVDDVLQKHAAEKDRALAEEVIKKVQASVQYARREGTFGYAFLRIDEKKEIHGRLNTIREIVSSSNLNDRKKNAILERLNALAREVDTGGTLTDRFFAFMGDLAFVAGEMTRNAKPAIDETKEILRIVTRARARAEGIELPKPKDWTLLPPSKETDSPVEGEE